MTPFILLISVFSIGILIQFVLKKKTKNYSSIARLAMSSMLIFIGISHFVFTEGMSAMLPEWMPLKFSIIYVTGIFEIIGAIALLLNKTSRLAGILLIVFLICILPANIYSAIHNINPLTGAPDGKGLSYLFFRIPLQLFFIAWIYLSAIKFNPNQPSIQTK